MKIAKVKPLFKETETELVGLMSVAKWRNERSIFYSKLAEQLADKQKETKSETVTWKRRKISFCLLRSVIRCIRGTIFYFFY